MLKRIVSIFLFASILLSSCTGTTSVAVLSLAGSEETDSLVSVISADGFACQVVSPEDDFTGYDLVWYHRSDTTEITAEEIALGDKIVSYVSKGGKLVLSMEAVRLSNAWGLEPNPVQQEEFEVYDDGFGRKLGYHGNRNHPIFDGQTGGMYVWHGYEDNTNRVLGYFEDNMPAAPDTRIIGTLWEYIYYHPTEKIIWEQKVGKGSILSIGAFLYYSRPNFHTMILERFTANVIDFMTGKKFQTEERYWTYGNDDVVLEPSVTLKKSSFPAPAVWELDDASDMLAFEATRSEVTIPSTRNLVVCEERSGIKEIWAHPIMSLKGYSVEAVLTDGTAVKLDVPCRDVELRYNSLTRYFKAGDATVREIIVPEVKGSAVVAHYDWDGGEIASLNVKFASNMRYMWPYESNALGSLYCGWSKEKGCYEVRDAESMFVSLVGSNLPGQILSEDTNVPDFEVRAALSFDCAGQSACDVVFAAGNFGEKEVEKEFDKAIAKPMSVYKESSEYWQKYLANTVSIETPDPIFNEGYRWATVSAGQFLAETPGLGTGLMAGYSSSLRGWGGGQRVSGRPGYAWYFGRDSELAALAFLKMGDFAAVKSNLELLADYQSVNGKIFHELTTSASDHFDASDATPLFVVLMADYLRATGDRKFVSDHMDNVYKAMAFCQTTDTDGDHFIEIEHVGHGWLEGGDYFVQRTEYYLSGIWARALSDAAYLASLFGDQEKADSFAAEFKVVREELEKYWNPKGYYNYGKDCDGSFTTAFLALPTFPVWMGVADEERAYEMVKGYARNDFSTDWGVRQTNDPRQEELVGAYDECNIWPLFTGSVSLAEYAVGRYNQGFEHMMASLICYRSASHGRVPEVLRGNSFRSGGITRHQCWSETAVTGPAIQGMVGFSCNAIDNTVVIAPRMPFDWAFAKVGNLACGKAKLGLDMTRTEGNVKYVLSSTGAVTVDFKPAFAPGTVVNSVMVNGRETEFEVCSEKEYLSISCPVSLNGESVVEISYDEGVSSLPRYVVAEDNALSTGVRVLGQTLVNGKLTVNVQGKPGTVANFPIYNKGNVESVEVSFAESGESVIELNL